MKHTVASTMEELSAKKTLTVSANLPNSIAGD